MNRNWKTTLSTRTTFRRTSKVLALEELASRLLRGPTPQPPAGSSRAPTPVQLQLADASPPQSRPPSPLALPVVAPATNTDTQPPNNVRLPKLTLPKFSGDSLEWQTFWDTFAAGVDQNTTLSGVQKFHYLRAQLSGTAAHCIAGLTATNANYEHAIELLRQRFGRSHKVTAAHMQALLHLAPPSATHRDLRAFHDEISCHIRGLEAAGRSTDTYGDCLVPVILERLPLKVRQQLTRDHGSNDWEITPLLLALQKEIEILEANPTFNEEATPPLSTVNFASAAQRVQRRPPPESPRDSQPRPCLFCQRPHHPQQCTTVTDPERRWDIVRSKRRCFNCLGPHRVSDCMTRARCRTCNRKHHTSLCRPQQTQRSHPAGVSSSSAASPSPQSPPRPPPARRTEQPVSTSTPAVSQATCAPSQPTCLAAGEQVILQTATTTVSADHGPPTRTRARLLLDSGSQRTYMSERLASKLRLQPVLEEPLSVSTFGDTRPFTVNTSLVHFQLGLKDGSCMALTANVIPNITGAIHRGTTPAADEAFLRALPPDMLADNIPSANDNASEVDLLIGSDFFWTIMQSDRLTLPSGLLLISSKLGYVLTGKCASNQPTKEVGTLFVHTQVMQSVTTSEPTFSSPADSCLAPTPNLADFWSLETIGITDDPTGTPSDTIHEDFKRTIRHVNGRYEVRWPWKDNAGELPDNFGLAAGRLKSLSRRFEHDPALLTQYNEVIENQLNKGIIERAPPDCQGSPTHYLPHQPVITPNKATTKLRVVYDASSKTQKTAKSLNDCLHRGPLLLPDLCGLLLRCRLSPVVLLADIERAFLQVGLHPADRDATRFLWYKDPSDPTSLNNNLAVYRFCRVPFGVISSPFLLQATIRHHLDNTEDPSAQVIADNIYVDNLILGLDSEQDAISMYHSATSIFTKASMNLREWSSNSDVVRAALPGQPNHLHSPVSILGLRWSATQDMFSIPCFQPLALQSAIITKRQVLQLIAQVYDPLGLFTPVLLVGKLFLRRLWELNLAWDEPLSSRLTDEWTSIAANISPLADIQLARCPAPVTAESRLSLHVFTDASKLSYATAVYLVVHTGSVRTALLVYSKMRLAPQKSMTIPRLELLGVVIGVRALKFVRSQLHRPVDSQHLWTDSRCVLFWLTSKKSMSRFVENRLKAIRSHDDLTFHYVPTQDNPADLATRGTSATDLHSTSQWWNGPPWLSLAPSAWPHGKHPDVTPNVLEQALQETAKMQPVHVSTLAARTGDRPPVSSAPFHMEPTRYSTLTRLHRVTALCMRFVARLVWTRLSPLTQQALAARHPLLGHGLNLAGSAPYITAENIRLANLWWIRALQQQQYPDVLSAMQARRQHHLQQQLHLRLDGFNILRCHSRLTQSDLHFDSKCPILLPRKTHYARLLVLDTHHNLLHSGVSSTLNQLQLTYWLCHGRAEVRRILDTCSVCRRHEGPAYRLPPMPALTKERVTRSRPFQYVGLDYLGPLIVVDRGERVKVWICLFTCLAVRAVHLECALGLSSTHFLSCLRRFVARRGCPERITSDNAPQFKLTRTALDREWDQRVTTFTATKGITWSFTTEYAPWQGGFYERLVGLCKRTLRKMIGRRLLPLSELQTLLPEVEAIVNLRPLTYVDQDHDGGLAITPAHFLGQTSSPCLALPSSTESASDDGLYLPTTDPADELRHSWKASMSTLDYFWSIWERDYLLLLRQRSMVRTHRQHGTVNTVPHIGDIVIVQDSDQPRANWKVGRVTEVIHSRDDLIRSARILMPTKRIITRPLSHLYPLEVSCTQPPDTLGPPPPPTASSSRPARLAAQKAQQRLADLFPSESQ